ncbi:MAG: GNAT family N-acetyltransferase [Candidatus Hermodarchaeota archaeon]
MSVAYFYSNFFIRLRVKAIMDRQYEIRRAELDDANDIHGVLLAAFEEYRQYYTPEGFFDTVMSEDIVKKRMKEMTLYVAIDLNGKIIGTIGWLKVSVEEGHIRGMAVIPERQGKNSPATDLLLAVENDARSKGCSFLTLDTTNPLKRAQNFYKKHGFRETGKIGDFFGSIICEYAKTIRN